jgi:hypothetical protein
MGVGGTMVGVRYSVGRMLVTIQDVVVLEVPFVFCAAAKIRLGYRFDRKRLTSSIFQRDFLSSR